MLRISSVLAISVGVAACLNGQGQAWNTLRDPRGASVQTPPGWRASFDPETTRINLSGTDGQRMTIWPVHVAEPLQSASAATMLSSVARKLDANAMWTAKPTVAGSSVRLTGTSGSQPAVASVAWVNTPRGAVAYFVLCSAPQAGYAASASVFARIFDSLRLTGGPESGAPSVRWTDPNERAFSMEIPQGWRMMGGTLRRAPVDVSYPWEMTSPDGASRVTGGDGSLPVFTLPSQMLQMGGLREGMWYSPGYNVRMLIRQFQPAATFLRSYITDKFRGSCTNLAISEIRDRTRELAQINAAYSQFRAQGMSLQMTGGDASFTCRQGGRELAGYYFATTLLAQQMGGASLWTVDQLYGYLAPTGADASAEQAMSHAVETLRFDPQWLAMQGGISMSVSKIVTQTGQEIARMSKESFELKNKVDDEAMRKFSNATLGLLDARDPMTGREFKVDNAKDYHWISPNGTILGTNTDARPAGIDARLLVTY